MPWSSAYVSEAVKGRREASQEGYFQFAVEVGEGAEDPTGVRVWANRSHSGSRLSVWWTADGVCEEGKTFPSLLDPGRF